MLNDGEKGVILQRDKSTYAVAPHFPCGVITPEQLRTVADVAERYGAAAVKITSAARIAIVGLREEVIDSVWKDLSCDPGAAVGLCVRSVKACPGTTFCKRGKQDSLAMGLYLDKRYHGMELPGKLKMGVSGCPNQCAETCIKDIGLVGMPEGWEIFVGGNGGGKPRLSLKIAEGLTDEEAQKMVEQIIQLYRSTAKKNHRLGRMIEVMGGIDVFRQALSSASTRDEG